MTAWFAIVAPMCIAVKCCIDFIVLEYGSKFCFATDKQFLFGCLMLCVYALCVDLGNVKRNRK